MRTGRTLIRTLVPAALALAIGAPAPGAGLVLDLDLEARGLRLSAGGTGLRALLGDPAGGDGAPALRPGARGRSGLLDARGGGPAGSRPGREGAITVDIRGPVVRALLFWSGAGTPHGEQEMLFDGGLVPGTLIGAESGPVTALAYVADVTPLATDAYAFYGPGTFVFDVQDPTPIDNLDYMDGAGLLVAYTDESDETVYRLQVFEGVDYAWPGAATEEGRTTTPVSFGFAPEAEARPGELLVMTGGATADGADRVDVSGQAPLFGRLTGADGPRWHTETFPVVVAADTGTLTTRLVAPDEVETRRSRSDALAWVVSALRLPVTGHDSCTGGICDLVWRDDDRDGCQDPGEPGLPDVRVTLFRLVEGQGPQFAGETFTAATGAYEFGGLCLGDYRVMVDENSVPPGYRPSPANACADEERDSDCIRGVVNVTLTVDGLVERTVDCGYIPTVSEREHPGWNWADNAITLTANEPAYWSALTGLPKGVSPWTALDPGDPPGRPDPDGGEDRVLRGYVLAWAIDDESGEEIRWNHLAADATIVNYRQGAAWQYNAYAFQTADAAVEHGAPTGTPGILNLDGTEYSEPYGELLLSFRAVGSSPYGGTSGARIDTDLVLHPVSADLRQESEGPVSTLIDVEVWNGNEVKFTGLSRCITGWDERLLSQYGDPNHFLVANLQTDQGKARIDGVASLDCLGSVSVPILGVVAQVLTDDGVRYMEFGTSLAGMGTEAGRIAYDGHGPPPERPVDGARVGASEKGSLLVIPKVEVRWDSRGRLVQDTLLSLTNDYPRRVRVKLYFVNGDPPLAPEEE